LHRRGHQHIRDCALSVRHQKTGKTLAIPLSPSLAAALDATPSKHLTFLVTEDEKPFEAMAFTKWFRRSCDAAGLSGYSAHGLRKAACRRLAEAGCSANEIAAISGHASLREVERYTRAADQARMARNAMARTGMATSGGKRGGVKWKTRANPFETIEWWWERQKGGCLVPPIGRQCSVAKPPQRRRRRASISPSCRPLGIGASRRPRWPPQGQSR